MTKSRTISTPIRGEVWELRLTRENLGLDTYGVCVHDNKVMIVDHTLSGDYLTDTVIHEVLHAALPDLREGAIEETATAVHKVLASLGVLKKRYLPD